MLLKFLPVVLLLLMAVTTVTHGQHTAAPPFSHPGLLHTRESLDRIKRQLKAGRQPWKDGFKQLARHRASKAGWKVRGPFAVVVCDPLDAPAGKRELVMDANAAYQNALMWTLTADRAHAFKSREILNAWSVTLRQVSGHDKELVSGLVAFKLLNAAELLRHTSDVWPPDEQARFARLLKVAFLPGIENFAPFANGNWDAACLKSLLAMGVYLDDRILFNRAVDYYRHGTGNGRLTHYVINPSGQCQESGRDQQHTQLGLGLLAEACEVAWNQSVDLYGEADNRLLRGFEYTARYNLGQDDMPFVPHVDKTGKYRHKEISTEGRGQLRPIYEMIWSHYEKRRGMAAPFSKKAAEKLRPEGAAWAADHPGFGTLLFSQPVAEP